MRRATWAASFCVLARRAASGASLVVLLAVCSAHAGQVVTIPCSRVDDFIKGEIEVPPGAEVRVSGLTLSDLTKQIGADSVARLLSTPQGRAALAAKGLITEPEKEWCVERARSEMMRRQREREAVERAQQENANPSVLGIAVIPFTPGRPIVVNALVNDTPARLVLDTGADSTVIAPRVLRTANALSLGRTIRLRGVAGEVSAPLYAVAVLKVGGVTARSLNVSAHDADQATDGLLGRDFLGRFLVTVDSAAGRVTLRQRTVDAVRGFLEEQRSAEDLFLDEMPPRSSRPGTIQESSRPPADALPGASGLRQPTVKWLLLIPPQVQRYESSAVGQDWEMLGTFDNLEQCEYFRLKWQVCLSSTDARARSHVR